MKFVLLSSRNFQLLKPTAPLIASLLAVLVLMCACYPSPPASVTIDLRGINAATVVGEYNERLIAEGFRSGPTVANAGFEVTQFSDGVVPLGITKIGERRVSMTIVVENGTHDTVWELLDSFCSIAVNQESVEASASLIDFVPSDTQAPNCHQMMSLGQATTKKVNSARSPLAR